MRIEGHQETVAQRILTAAHETQPLAGNIERHGFFEPGNAFRPHMNRHCQSAARAGAALRIRTTPVAVGGHVSVLFESQSDPHGGWPACAWLATKHERGNFGLPIGYGRIIRKRDPQAHTGSMKFLTRDKQTTARNVPRLANFASLTEGRSPPQSYREAEPHAVVLAARHFLNHTARK
jgi:hypothetical protein